MPWNRDSDIMRWWGFTQLTSCCIRSHNVGKTDQFCKMYSNSNIILSYSIIFWKKYSSILKSKSSNMIFTWCKYCFAVGRCILKVLWHFLLFYNSTVECNQSIFMMPVTFYGWGDLETKLDLLAMTRFKMAENTCMIISHSNLPTFVQKTKRLTSR